MDLQDFNVDTLYFEAAPTPEIDGLLSQASQAYGNGGAETYLLRAYSLAPGHLSVLVGLYRFYFYQHRYQEALLIAQQLLQGVAPRIGFPDHWRNVRTLHLEHGVTMSIGFVRFYLLVLKAAAYVQLRLGAFQEGKDMLRKIVDLDGADRLGAKHLLATLDNNSAHVIPFPGKASKEA